MGPKNNSLIHIIWNDYGPMVCTDFINNTQRLINTWLLYYNSFSVGLSDSVVSDSINSQIQQILYDTKKSVNQSIIDTENGIGDFDFNTLEKNNYKLMKGLIYFFASIGIFFSFEISHYLCLIIPSQHQYHPLNLA